MLEKIGLPPKPSLRGNNWVIDASHCQGCSSQFTFINRKHHCRRCGGLFCGSCTQQRMYLRGQGESPVRICDPCKTLEEAARFEMRYGHKNKSRKGGSKLASDNEDDVSVNGSVSSDKESVPSASVSSVSNSDMEFDRESTTPEELRQRAVEEKNKYKVLKAEKKPEEALRAFKRGKELERQAAALEIELRKNRKKAVSSASANENSKVADEKKPKDKDDLVSELRELGWSDHDLNDADKKPVSMTLEGELSSLLKEVSQKSNKPEKGNVGIDRSEVVAIKKNALALKREGKLTEAKEELKRAKILEKQIEERELLGDDEDSDDEFASLIRSMDIDKQDILAHGNDRNPNLDFDHLLRMDDGPHLDGNFDVTEEDMDDPEMSAALQSLGWTEDHDAVDKESRLSEIQSLKREALDKKRAGNTAEALALLKQAKLLEAEAGGTHDTRENDDVSVSKSKPDFDHKLASKSKLEIQRELLALKKKALALRREGKVDEADQELAKGKALEQRLEELENASKVNMPKVKPASMKHADFSAPIMDAVEDQGEDVTDTDMNDPSYLALLENLGWQDDVAVEAAPPKQQKVAPKKSKAEIQRELLALKRKSLALRRQGNVDEAEEVLQATKDLEAQLEELETPSQQTTLTSNSPEKPVVSEVFVLEKPRTGIKEESSGSMSTEKPQVPVTESNSVQQQILAHKRKAVSLKREGKLAEAKEELKQAKLLEKESMDVHNKSPDVHTEDTNKTPVPSTSKVTKKEETDDTPPPKLSSRERFKLQQQSLTHKRQALKLRREGRHEEADAEFELAKNLESQLEAANELTKPAEPVDDVGIEDLLDPQLLYALREVGIEGPLVHSSPEKTEPVRTRPVVNKTQAEPVKAKLVVNKSETAELEEQIKAEKVKALNLKRAGKQAEALDALRRAKVLEKKLNSLA
ncbi:putative chromatin regulator PHD family [Helianthus annuus]|nr:putative chromatin regulator PHD family [Helianthus annuus]